MWCQQYIVILSISSRTFSFDLEPSSAVTTFFSWWHWRSSGWPQGQGFGFGVWGFGGWVWEVCRAWDLRFRIQNQGFRFRILELESVWFRVFRLQALGLHRWDYGFTIETRDQGCGVGAGDGGRCKVCTEQVRQARQVRKQVVFVTGKNTAHKKPNRRTIPILAVAVIPKPKPSTRHRM